MFYDRAIASTSGKEQLLKQFETIVAGMKRNKAMVTWKNSFFLLSSYSIINSTESQNNFK